MSHTPEPWILRQGNEIGVTDKSDTQSYGMLNVIARVDKYDFENWQENARHIVACVNYCEGEPTAALELSTLKEQIDLKVKFSEELNQLRLEYITSIGETQTALEQRDTYRDLCAELVCSMKKVSALTDSTKSYRIASEAIIKAEAILGEKK